MMSYAIMQSFLHPGLNFKLQLINLNMLNINLLADALKYFSQIPHLIQEIIIHMLKCQASTNPNTNGLQNKIICPPQPLEKAVKMSNSFFWEK